MLTCLVTGIVVHEKLFFCSRCFSAKRVKSRRTFEKKKNTDFKTGLDYDVKYSVTNLMERVYPSRRRAFVDRRSSSAVRKRENAAENLQLVPRNRHPDSISSTHARDRSGSTEPRNDRERESTWSRCTKIRVSMRTVPSGLCGAYRAAFNARSGERRKGLDEKKKRQKYGEPRGAV